MKRSVLSKLKSTKLIVTLWAMVLVTYIIISGQSDFVPIATILSAAPMVYCGVNLGQHYIEDRKVKREEM